MKLSATVDLIMSPSEFFLDAHASGEVIYLMFISFHKAVFPSMRAIPKDSSC